MRQVSDTELQSTVTAAPPESDPAGTPVAVDGLDPAGAAGRYGAAEVLGHGGMGEVRLCRDAVVGRQVAMKVVLSDRAGSTDARQRFLREARVQGQLEHPAIVPLYDLGVTPGGESYFTMRRVKGVTLAEVIAGLRRGEAAFTATYSRRRLLTAFSSICLAVDYAHRRGVLHRDLKPGNVMLGDFGEVYILDWGLARLTRGPAADEEAAERALHDQRGLADPGIELPAGSGSTPTQVGATLGTPGYMSPEQARGDLAVLDGRTDIYALGALLFELLTFERLHDRRTPAALFYSTLHGAEARASVRRPEAQVPPELEDICVRATALDPAARFADARALQAAVERYLDGDRDLERRRELAGQHLQRAEEGLARETTEADRARVLRELGQALGLDPGNRPAMTMLVKLLTTPPPDLPEAAREEQHRDEGERQTSTQRMAIGLSMAMNAACLPLLLWMGVRSWMTLVVVVSVVGLAAPLLQVLSKQLRWSSERTTLVGLGGSLLVMMAGTRVAGPFLLVPGVATLLAAASALDASRRLRIGGALVGCLAVLLTVLLETAGVLPPSYAFRDGTMVILPQLLHLPELPTRVTLTVVAMAVVINAAVGVGRVRDSFSAVDQRLRLQGWQLRQLVPEEGEPGRPG
jgi:serine/threonine-protein kinase